MGETLVVKGAIYRVLEVIPCSKTYHVFWKTILFFQL